MRNQLGSLSRSVVKHARGDKPVALLVRRQPSSRWMSISATPSSSTPQLDQLPINPPNSNLEGPDAQFEVLGAPYSLLSVSLSASQTLYTRRGTLVGLSGQPENTVSSLKTLEPLRRAVLGIPFFYQKITSASPIRALVSTKSPLTSFTVVHLDGTLDWMITQRRALLAWTGQTLSITPKVNYKLSVAHWGFSQVTGRGLLGLAGNGQIYQVTLREGESYVAHPGNVLAYTISQNQPQPYRFKSSTLRIEVPGLSRMGSLLPEIKFFRNMQETATWKFFHGLFYTLRTWSRRTIFGDRLFLRFEGPMTLLLQTRASRMTDVFSAREVNEIADVPAGAIASAVAIDMKAESQNSNTPKPTGSLTYENVGGTSQVTSEPQGGPKQA